MYDLVSFSGVASTISLAFRGRGAGTNAEEVDVQALMGEDWENNNGCNG